MSNREVELKLSISEEGYNRLVELLPAKGEVREQENFFFDTPDLAMRAEGWALRLRRDDQRWFLTAKGPSQREDGISDREEVECSCTPALAEALLEGGSIQLSEFEESPAERCMELFGDLCLERWMSFENRRLVLLWDEIAMELDHCTSAGQNRYELEIELPMGELVAIRERLETYLKKNAIFITPCNESKLAWATACRLQQVSS